MTIYYIRGYQTSAKVTAFPKGFRILVGDSMNRVAKSHVAHPASGTFESGGAYPSTHPVKTPQVMYEAIFDTRHFNKADWPADGSQPFYLSTGDNTGYGIHGDYLFGCQGNQISSENEREKDPLPKIMASKLWIRSALPTIAPH
ncbi:WSC domain-containing protein [Seiridium cupressi]